MKTLLLFRHGKSDWSSDTGEDRDRPLARRGEKAARSMGEWLTRAGRVPDAALTSPAVRARTTLELAMKAGGWDCPVAVSESLYGAGVPAVVDEIRRQPDDVGTLLLVGHEPTWSESVQLLVGGGRHRVPTGAVAGIDFDVDTWDTVRAGGGELAFLVAPRLIAGK